MLTVKRAIVLPSIVVSFVAVILRRVFPEDISNSQSVACVHPALDLPQVDLISRATKNNWKLLESLIRPLPPQDSRGGCAQATSEKTIVIVTCVTLRKFP